MKKHNLSKNKVFSAIVAFTFFILQSNFGYAYGHGNVNDLPQGAVTVNGTTNIDYVGHHTLDITASNNAIINWNSFNIGQHSTVDFIQPNSSSVILNRVVGVDPSSIYGVLNANGRVFIVNPNGIFFGPNSQVNVNSIVASTLDISNNNFINGNYTFSQHGKSAWIINQGKIHVANGGYVLLLSDAINNSGVIEARLGRVLLAAGEKMTVALDDDRQISVTIDDAVKHGVFGPDGAKITQAIKNSGTIDADGGTVLLNAKILNGIFDNAVNNSGVIQANSLVHHNGSIEIVANGGNVALYSGSAISANSVTIDATTYISQKGRALITGNQVTLTAGKGIGSHGAIKTNASTLIAQVWGRHGSINIDNISDKTVTLAYVSTNNGNITVTSNGSIDAKNVNSRGGDINLTAKQNIEAGNINAGWGNVYLTAMFGYIEGTWNSLISGNLIDLNARKGIGSTCRVLKTDANKIVADVWGRQGSINIDNISDKTVTLSYVSTNDGSIAITSYGSMDAQDVQSRGGNINLTAKNDMEAGNINGGSGNVFLTALFGYIEGTWNSLISGNLIDLNAKKGIGSTCRVLKTDANKIMADVSGRHGSINIDNISDKTVTLAYVSTNDGSIAITSHGSIDAKDVQSRGGDIDLTAKKNITVGIVDAGRGDVELTAWFGYITGGWNSLITGNGVVLDAEKGIGGGCWLLKTDAKTIIANVWGRHGSITLDNVSHKAVTLAYVSTRDGNITINADGSIKVNDVNAGTGNVSLRAKHGSITGTKGSADITAHVIDLNAGGNVDLNFIGDIINLKAGGYADLLTDQVILDTVKTGGNFTLEALTGNITLDGIVQSTGGGVDLKSDNGNINANAGSEVIANANSFFSTPHGTIGVQNGPVYVDINGNLVLDIESHIGSNSGNLRGTVTASPGIPTFAYPPTNYPSPLIPPGNVYFNGIRIWPPSSESQFLSEEEASNLIVHFVFPDPQTLALTQVNTFDFSTSSSQTGGGGLFLYHPLTDIDSGALNQGFQLDEGAYDFIDGNILKKGH